MQVINSLVTVQIPVTVIQKESDSESAVAEKVLTRARNKMLADPTDFEYSVLWSDNHDILGYSTLRKSGHPHSPEEINKVLDDPTPFSV